jgi:hypothetical protein
MTQPCAADFDAAAGAAQGVKHEQVDAVLE